MSLNYIGSKKTLIEFLEIPIKKIISDDKIYTLLDGFAGVTCDVHTCGLKFIS